MMFHCAVDPQTDLRLVGVEHIDELFHLFEANRDHLRRWHPWVDLIRTVADVEKAVAFWQQQCGANAGIHAGIWFKGRLCGMIGHQTVDWSNRWAALSFWLDAGHQGQGIMTACCRAMLEHAFNMWKLNRITIECATKNARSRAIPERLGFKLEGVTREIEWLHDHFADHAIYGLLRADYAGRLPK